jgi:hypothetical protein
MTIDPSADDDAIDGKTHLLSEIGSKYATETTALLRKPIEFITGHAHPGPCNHGTFSPRLGSRAESVRSGHGFGGFPSGGGNPGEGEGSRGIFESMMENLGMKNSNGGGKKKMSTTNWLAEQHGITNTRTMYFSYYIPFLAWVKQYKWSYLRGDLIAALTMASFYIPMSLSFASNLGHIPPINGLYSFVFNPFIYAFLGSCPQMVVGPEAAGSLLVGSVVRSSVDSGKTGDRDDEMNARVAGVVTGMAGAVIFIAGLTRLGFLDSVLSRPFLRGFISAIGFVIVVDQLIPEMGLHGLADQIRGVSHGSCVDKLGFLFRNAGSAHGLTCIVAGASFLIIMVFR